jgi:hypothetical protein
MRGILEDGHHPTMYERSSQDDFFDEPTIPMREMIIHGERLTAEEIERAVLIAGDDIRGVIDWKPLPSVYDIVNFRN